MKKIIFSVIGLAATFANAQIIMEPPTTSGRDVALIMVQGPGYPADGYIPVIQQIQQFASQNGINLFASVPTFPDNKADAGNIITEFKKSMDGLKSKGFTGNDVFLAGHSDGGAIALDYAIKGTQVLRGVILEGSIMKRDQRSIESNGFTKFSHSVPTLTLCGELDGIMRISRCAESHWHQTENIDQSQKDLFPVVALKGLSHWRFSSGAIPDTIKQNDLRAEIEEKDAHTQIAQSFVGFFGQILKIQSASQLMANTQQVDLKPLVNAMVMEGSFYMKKMCNSGTTVNVEAPDCLKGSPYINQFSSLQMAGEILNKNIKVVNDDNFHIASTLIPYHHPSINSTCDGDTQVECKVNTISTTENIYESTEDNGKHAVGATEMKTKFKSREAIQLAAGNKKADFHEMDEVTDRCGEINKDVIQWAYDHSSDEAKKRYDSYGEKLVVGADLGPYNDGPSWIWRSLQYNENKEKTQVSVQSPAMKFKADFFLEFSAGIHYCKVLSPFRAMEWIYFDSLKGHYMPQTQVYEAFLQ